MSVVVLNLWKIQRVLFDPLYLAVFNFQARKSFRFAQQIFTRVFFEWLKSDEEILNLRSAAEKNEQKIL